MTYKLEDMLNDCAVIRTTFETLDLFPADDPIRGEMQVIVNDARANMRRRCAEMRDNVSAVVVFDSLLNIQRFSKAMRMLLMTGYPRRCMDAYMKVDVFHAVEKIEASDNAPDTPYLYTLLLPLTVPALLSMNAGTLVVTVLDDLLQSVERDANFEDKHAFDRNIFQKYIAVMFVCLYTDDPLFYT